MTTREELLETLRRLAVEQGPDITLYRFREETGISRNIVYDRWGNWTNLRVAAGLPRRVTIAPVYSEDELLGEFHAAAREVDRYPTLGEFSRLSDRSLTTFDRRFGPKPALIDRYRAWLEPQPADVRPAFLAGIEPDCEPSVVPGLGVLREAVPPMDLSTRSHALRGNAWPRRSASHERFTPPEDDAERRRPGVPTRSMGTSSVECVATRPAVLLALVVLSVHADFSPLKNRKTPSCPTAIPVRAYENHAPRTEAVILS